MGTRGSGHLLRLREWVLLFTFPSPPRIYPSPSVTLGVSFPRSPNSSSIDSVPTPGVCASNAHPLLGFQVLFQNSGERASHLGQNHLPGSPSPRLTSALRHGCAGLPEGPVLTRALNFTFHGHQTMYSRLLPLCFLPPTPVVVLRCMTRCTSAPAPSVLPAHSGTQLPGCHLRAVLDPPPNPHATAFSEPLGAWVLLLFLPSWGAESPRGSGTGWVLAHSSEHLLTGRVKWEGHVPGFLGG